jgi:hypothetical protein
VIHQKDVTEIFGNVGTIITFRVGATDATLLARQFGADVPEPRDLVNLANYEFFVKLMIDGTQSKPFSARTLPYVTNDVTKRKNGASMESNDSELCD